MNLYFNTDLAKGYKSPAQIARVLTENWLGENAYCPSCGCAHITKAANNRPVLDFDCPNCAEQFELKSKQAKSAGKVINDGAYATMLARIQAADNPNFFFLSYNKADYSVRQLMLVPKHFFTPEMIIRRKPLPETAKRAGWIGCNINIGALPNSGKILLVDKGIVMPSETVHRQWQQNLFLRQQKNEGKGWLLAVMRCVEALPEQFTLAQMYAFENVLQQQFPANRHIKDKIRQQLQWLRNQGIIEFSARGQYRKIPQSKS
ncbi:restriction endonuclease [Uruburuella suis]|uniref:Restriction endonuclease n=1 Tax=Uruburuella suis TaxID=252130 RepID=A0AAE9GUX9_9NEIS|nr:DpnI domain-containing protein [Uruburuella suis]TCP09298.1 type II restriction enzyme [Uruburuella suis]UOO79459.1 restriction endonuclease [Uruburuella suis]